jgi:hypothetical protein
MKALLGTLLAVGLVVVPLERAAACDCALIELPDAIGDADVAFVGTLVTHVPGGDNFGFAPLDEWHWSVERSRDAGSDATITINAAADDGANCGVTFATGERWLVIASIQQGLLQTSGCHPNQRMDGSAPEAEALVTELLAHEIGSAESGAPDLPMPMLLALGAVVVVGAVGLAAFRRSG